MLVARPSRQAYAAAGFTGKSQPMFATPAFAQAAGAPATGGAPAWLGILPWVAVFIIMYMLMFRPQQRRMKQHQAMIAAVKKNDVVVTGGGLLGKVTKVDETEVEVELAPGVRVKALKSTLTDVRPHGVKPAND